MKNHELLDMIGEVNEDYVLAAGDNVVRPRFGWKKLAACAACAACAALVLCAYPAWRMTRTVHSRVGHGYEEVPLHAYTVVEGGALTTEGELKVPAAGGGMDAPAQDAFDDRVSGGQQEADASPRYTPAPEPYADPGGAYVGGETDMETEPDASVDERAASQYDGLLRGMGGQGGYEPDTYPQWFAGAWIDHGGSPTTPAWLTVAIVDGFRTPELEAQIEGWCGGEIVLTDAKYSLEYLNGLMEPATRALDGTGLACGIGVDVTANCLGVDLYSDGAVIPDSVLAELARLDPDGDAIRVRLFTQSMSTLTDEAVKGPAPDAPVFDGARVDPIEPAEFSVPEEKPVPTPAPGGARVGEELPETKEAEAPAHYDLLPHNE